MSDPPEPSRLPTVRMPNALARRLQGWAHRLVPLHDEVMRLGLRLIFSLLALALASVALGILAAFGGHFYQWVGGAAGLALLGRAAVALLGLAAIGTVFLAPLMVSAEAALHLALHLDAGMREGRLGDALVRFQLVELRGRRALAFHVTFPTGRLSTGDQVEVEVRLRWRGGPPLRARLPRYRGSEGEAVARELADPVQEDDALKQTVGLLLPLQAVELPEVPVQPLTLEALVTLRLGGERDEVREEIEFLPRSSDYETLAEAAPPALEDVGHLEATTLGADARCPVCGDDLDEAPTRCEVCETPHHRECWEWSERCSTFGCPGGASWQGGGSR